MAVAQRPPPTKPSPAVSIVVPCFNGGHFFDGLMASLARQTFRDFEIVIVDDGSGDPQTLRKLLALDGQATVIRQMNRGPAAARNAGIRRAKAELVFALDCDDTIEPDFLAETVPLLRASPPDVGMAFTDLRLTGAEFHFLLLRDSASRRHRHHRGHCRTRSESSHIPRSRS